MMYIESKNRFLIVGILGLFVIFLVFFNFFESGDFSCVVNNELRIVNGNSLSGLIESGAEVNILYGYYACNVVNRNDVVVYNYSGSENSLIKIVKGLPKDTFNVSLVDGFYVLVINGGIVRNSDGEIYVLDRKQRQMILLYVNSYGGVIPENTYLILGNLVFGSLDSTRFGLVSRRDIVGKVVY
ncbi:signal peptidase I [archaeon]|nr:signal peptidase I [archaeon]